MGRHIEVEGNVEATQEEDAWAAIDEWRSRSPFTDLLSREEYMAGVAERAVAFDGTRLDVDDPVDFVLQVRELLARSEDALEEYRHAMLDGPVTKH